MKFTAQMDLEASAKALLRPNEVITPGAFGTGKKTVKLYSGLPGTPNRRVIGEAEIDLETGLMVGDVEDAQYARVISGPTPAVSYGDDISRRIYPENQNDE